eukprot:6336948-Prymnesium_polylepis.1
MEGCLSLCVDGVGYSTCQDVVRHMVQAQTCLDVPQTPRTRLLDAARRCQAVTVQDARAHGLSQIVHVAETRRQPQAPKESPGNRQTTAGQRPRQRLDSGQTTARHQTASRT